MWIVSGVKLEGDCNNPYHNFSPESAPLLHISHVSENRLSHYRFFCKARAFSETSTELAENPTLRERRSNRGSQCSISAKPCSWGATALHPKETASGSSVKTKVHVRHLRGTMCNAKAYSATSLHQFLNERLGGLGGHSQVSIRQRPLVQDRLRCVQGRDVGALEEFANGDFVTPQHRFSHRCDPV